MPTAGIGSSSQGPLGLSPGDETTRSALADLLNYRDSTPLERGMFKPASGPYKDHLFLFHDPEHNPYGDVVGPERIDYVGQGMKGDQRLSSFNQYLAEHLARGLTVHFFVREQPGQLTYGGEVVCERFDRVYRVEEQRSVLRFSLVRTAPVFGAATGSHEPLIQYEAAKQEILHQGPEPRLIERPIRLSVAQRLVRDVAFRDIVLDAYKKTCAVCGAPLRRDSMLDLQAAHIVGVAEQGPDDPRNGLSLCHRHHWAFDHGIFSLTDDLRILPLVREADPHGEIIDRAPIMVPSVPSLSPHPFYIAPHRAKWSGA